MAEESSTVTEATIIKKRKAFMINHKTSKITKTPTKRLAHFIKPTLNHNASALPPKFQKIQSFSSSSNPNVEFLRNTTHLKGWKTWVEKLETTHEAEWRKAGIFDAIKCSTCNIPKATDLIVSLVEKWCPETNTFVFPWGEATVTLEDVYVLAGFSPLGAPVTSNVRSILDENEGRIEVKLFELYHKLAESGFSEKKWLEHFMGIGDQLEYAGFLALWLSHNVFFSRANTVVRQTVFATAARISCGAKLALGPVILGSIYRKLTSLKKGCGRLSSLLDLVQVWAWERFPCLGVVPGTINEGESRFARWEGSVWNFSMGIGVVKRCLDSARETFRWRPYNVLIENWSLPRFYVDSGMWVVAGSHERWRLFSRCLMAGELDGLDFVERYNPHRVALQFGFDQDIPGSVGGIGYMQNVTRLKMYLPPRLQEGEVTYRYFNWWRTMVNVNDEGRVCCKRKKKTRQRAGKMAKVSGRSQNVEEFPAQNVLEVGDDIGMACVFNREAGFSSEEVTRMDEGKENEVSVNNHSVSEGNNRSVDQEDGNLKLFEMLPEIAEVIAEHQNFANVVGQVKVMGPSTGREEGSRQCQDNSREQNLIEHTVTMDKSSETPGFWLKYESRMCRLEKKIFADKVTCR